MGQASRSGERLQNEGGLKEEDEGEGDSDGGGFMRVDEDDDEEVRRAIALSMQEQ